MIAPDWLVAKAAKAAMFAAPGLPLSIDDHERLARATVEAVADDLRGAGWETAIASLTYSDGSPVEVMASSNPFIGRTA